ncbi:hypothetical protein [Lacinutrix algicola]|uniref:hypothetical protein n=1 Tax=Lacinutrix algicola TaxID=342954 RepID=UPI0006E374B7|nr:hypothetical protein [Lacinutrix algicola]
MKNFKLLLVLCLFVLNGFGQEIHDEDKVDGSIRLSLSSYISSAKVLTYKDYVNTNHNTQTLLKTFQNPGLTNYRSISDLFMAELNLSMDGLSLSQITKFNIPQDDLYIILSQKKENLFYGDKILEAYKIEANNKIIYFVNKNNGVFLKKHNNIVSSIANGYVYTLNVNYDCEKSQVVSENVLDNNLAGIKNAVFFGNEDAVSSNTAISYLNGTDGDKINVGFNYAYKQNHFLNTSIYKSSKGSSFFKDGGWQDNIGASLTYNYVKYASQFFDRNTCEILEGKRKDYYKKLKEEIIIYSNQYISIKNEIKELEVEKKKIIRNNNSLSIDNINRIDKIDSMLVVYNKKQAEYDKISRNTTKYIDDKIEKFDEENDVLQGHYLKWWSFTGNIENQNLSLDSLNMEALKDPIKNIPTLKFGTAFNWSRENNALNSSRLNGFAQLFVNVEMSSFLQSIQKDRTPTLLELDNEVFVFDDLGTQLGKYSDLKRAYWTSTIGGNFTSFPFSKHIGLTSIFNHRFALQDLENIDYKNRYTAQVGLVFRVQKDDVNKASFRILAGAEDLLYSQKTFKDASVKISVGIPFNLFTKE